MFRSVIGSVVLYPTEAVSAERAVELAARHRGIVYIRTSRPNTPVLYANDESFAIGKAKVLCTISRNLKIFLIISGAPNEYPVALF